MDTDDTNIQRDYIEDSQRLGEIKETATRCLQCHGHVYYYEFLDEDIISKEYHSIQCKCYSYPYIR